ncbi:helix-turn-helix domain-containing protein [Nocardioides speluncae]|uniref:helix-turn-helix domain-containing protein n=1 Tax=Nocardioides speluncae TaxID=2670337 RepID=UPI000D692F9F|nr:helix-turn-helix transcriptional regulator [Nocardioides speluncae]
MGIGALIADLRRARGWSQGRLADAINDQFGTNLDREYVSRWERCKVRPGAFYLRCLSAVLDVPLAVLEGEEVHRRAFLSSIAATAIAPVVASDLIESGFASRLAGGPSAEAWEAKLAAYGTDYMSLGAADIQRRVAHELVVVQQQLDNPRLWSVASRLMTLYAKTFPGSDGERAVGWYRMAAKAADESGDADARVWVRGRAAIALGYEGAALGVADAVAEEALAISEKPSLGRLNAIMGRAHAAAIRGDTARARSLLTEGRRAFDKVGSDEQTSDYAVPWWRMNVFVSLLAARLGDERTAVEAQDAARRELPDSLPRFATHLDMHRGLMLARAGDRAGGASQARAALDALPPEKHSLTLRMLMDEIEGGAGRPAS